MNHRRVGMALTAAATALLLAACGSSSSSGSADGGHPEHGDEPVAEISGGQSPEEATVLSRPWDKPDVVLTDTEGRPFDLAAETDGHATLIYFGYTHCPDVCPLTMSNIALGAYGLSEEQRDKLRVIMITSDPERDTPESLGEWLAAQDADFIGLTGEFTTIQETARSLGVALEEPYVDDNGDIVSTHGAQVIAFLPTDDRAHVIYTEGVTAETFERDLPKLIEGELP
ncbi:SCO family protein [Streptomyces aidingensis]|uniref:Protein SCO1/2 n=1 Tax=Streptomyces aidingensis TaxID=910347 RepID=A0A1I1QL31_9ACTN|nr:SCO family protein [Streptomyces aidingensis]SFD20548.1 protein SCO1/2 [Streptomyces aidingensis]